MGVLVLTVQNQNACPSTNHLLTEAAPVIISRLLVSKAVLSYVAEELLYLPIFPQTG